MLILHRNREGKYFPSYRQKQSSATLSCFLRHISRCHSEGRRKWMKTHVHDLHGCWLSLSPIDPVSGFLAAMDSSIHSSGSCVPVENALFFFVPYMVSGSTLLSQTLFLHIPSSHLSTTVLFWCSSSSGFHSEDSIFLEFFGEKEMCLSSYWTPKAQ